VDKTEFEDKVVLGDQRERGIQSDMGGAYHKCVIMDMQNRRWSDSICPSDTTTGKDHASYQRLYPGIMYEQTTPAKNRFTTVPSGGPVVIKPDSSELVF
jgi:hypothetical protein